MPTRKIWDHEIELKEEFVPRKGKVYPLSREERGIKRVYNRTDKERVYQTVKVTTNYTGSLCRKEEWKEKNSTRLLISQ